MRAILVLALSVLLVACESSGALQVQRTKVAPVEPGRIVALSVTGAQDLETQQVLAQVQDHLYGLLVRRGLFGQVVSPDRPAHYDLFVAVGGVDRKTGVERALIGPIIGPDRIAANVRLGDRVTGREITAFTAYGESAIAPLGEDNDMNAAIRQMGVQIMRGLR